MVVLAMEMQGPAENMSPIPERLSRNGWFAAYVRRVRDQLGSLMQEHASPGRLGMAVAFGVMMGCSPFLGLQLLLGVALATVFRLNRIAVILGAQVSVPPITALVFLANAQVGSIMLHGHWLSLSLDIFRGIPVATIAADLFLELLVGGLLVGGILGAVLGGLTTYLVKKHRARRLLREYFTLEQWAELQRRLGALPRAWRSYARWKLRLDPVYPLVLAQLATESELLDLGAGIGLLSLLVAIKQPQIRVRAVEWDARKVKLARALLEGIAGAKVEEGDARQCALGHPHAVAIIDVLHYSSAAEQTSWLKRCAQALQPGGTLIIRELDPRRARQSWSSRLENIAVWGGWNRGGGVHPRPSAEIAQDLTALGMTVVRQPAGWGPFGANSLLIARKQIG